MSKCCAVAQCCDVTLCCMSYSCALLRIVKYCTVLYSTISSRRSSASNCTITSLPSASSPVSSPPSLFSSSRPLFSSLPLSSSFFSAQNSYNSAVTRLLYDGRLYCTVQHSTVQFNCNTCSARVVLLCTTPYMVVLRCAIICVGIQFLQYSITLQRSTLMCFIVVQY